jgi:hypothetical protein
MGTASVSDRLSLAALITLLFALSLLPLAVAHNFLDQWLDADSPAAMFPGHRHPDGLVAAANPLSRVLRGLRDVLIAVAAAFPTSLLGLGLRPGRWSLLAARAEWATPAALTIPLAGALVVLGVGITAVSLGRTEVDPEHAVIARRPVVTVVPAGAAARAGDLRLTPRAVKWIRHAHPVTLGRRAPAMPAAAPESHRLSVEFTIANTGSSRRTFARSDIRLQAPSGRAWSPAGDDFAPMLLAPQEAVTSLLVFEVPAAMPGLEIAWTFGGREIRIPIGGVATHHGTDSRHQGS